MTTNFTIQFSKVLINSVRNFSEGLISKGTVLFFLLSVGIASAQSIVITNVTPNPVCAGSAVNVTFNAVNANGSNKFTNSTVYSAFISNGTTATSLGSSTISATYNTANGGTTTGITKSLTIPSGLAAGTNYRIYFTTTSPSYTGSYSSGSSANITVQKPVANAGPAMASICMDGTSAPLGGSVSGSATGGTWSSVSGGTFSPSATDLNATYTPPEGFTGTVTLVLTTSGGDCGSTTASKTIVVSGDVETPIFTLGSSSTRCQAAGTVSYAATATNSTSITYSLDSASANAGNIVNASGVVTYVAGWSGTTTITATANGCNGPETAAHTVTMIPASVGGTVSSAQTICSGTQPAELTLSGNTGNVVKWQRSSTADFASATDINSTSTTLSGATIGNVSQNTYFRAVVQNQTCATANSSSVLITVTSPSVGGTVSSAQTICSGSTPANLTLGGNTGSVVKWQRSADAAFTSPTDISSTSTTLTGATIGSLTANTYFRAVVQNGTCPAANSSSVLITVNSPSVGGTVSSNQTVCAGSQPAAVTLSGQTGSVVKWQRSTSSTFATFTDIASTSTTLSGASIGVVSQTTYVRAVVQNGVCPIANSAFATITVDQQSVGGVVSPNQTICEGTQPAAVTLTGNVGNIVFWQRSTQPNFQAGNTTTVNSTNATLSSQIMGSLSETTYFRAVVQNGVCSQAFSQRVTITVNENITYYADADGDGFGNAGMPLVSCTGQPAGYVTNNSDCDDSQVTYADMDEDGFGSDILVACGGVSNSSDCDDEMVMYADADGDGYGTEVMVACNGVMNSDDCNDTLAAINPAAEEILYNGIDDNCDGQLDEGFQIVTKIQSSQCGSTLAALNSIVYADNVNNSTAYRFEVTNNTTGTVQVLERPLRWFTFDMLASATYSTAYTVRVQIQRNGIWLGYYGQPCIVSTPNVTAANGAAQIAELQCGTILSSVSSIISSNSIPNVTMYRFRVTNLSNPSAPQQVQIIDRPLRWFSLTMLNTFNYGTTYAVEVAVRVGSAPISGYGSACMVTTPSVPMLENCGQSVANASEVVLAENRNKVTSYRFELTNQETNVVTTIDRPVRWFSFNMVPNFVAGAEYGVRISVMTNNSYSPFGEACVITAPGAAKTVTKDSVAVSELQASGYPNPFANSFSIALDNEFDFDVKIYDMTGRLIESLEAVNASTELGQQYPSGVYNVILSQQGVVKTLRMIKR